MPNIKSIGLSVEYKAKRLRRIIYMREMADPPVKWLVIAKRLGLGRRKVIMLYEEAKLGN